MFGKHAAYIIPSYAITVFVIAALLAWIVYIHRKRKQELANLEAKGFKRGGEKS
jgi:heme exporter protein D